MRIFTTNDFIDRINFVDENNVFVGYNYSQNCCETFGYSFSFQSLDLEAKNENHSEFGFDGYLFDTSYVKHWKGEYEESNAVEFRLTKLNHPDIFLVLSNYHNGYYGHGFEFTDANGKIIEDGVL